MRRLISLPLLLLAVSATASITGTVIDEDGKPIAGATVRAWVVEPTRVFRQRLVAGQPDIDPFVTATTSDAGAFSIDTKGAIAVELRIDKTGRQTAMRDAVDGDEPLTVILRPATQRTVRVIAGGKPVANALVIFGWPHLTARTDAAGEAPMPDDMVSWVIHPDFAIMRPTMTMSGTRLDAVLQKGVALRGRVVNAKGEGVKAALFIAAMPVGTSGGDGAFTIAHAPANWASLVAVAGGDAALVTHSNAPQLELRLARGLVVSGGVRDEITGRGVPGARVNLGTQGDREGFDGVLTDAKGNFTFDAVPPQSYVLNARHPAYGIEQLSVAVGGNTNRVLAARSMARVRGHVVDAGGKPIAGAAVGASLGRPSAITDAAGAFAFRLPAAPMMMVSITAMKRGYAAGAAPRRRFKEGESVNDVLITLQTGFPLQIKVVDARRQPVAGAVVYANRADEDTTFVSAACDDPWRDDCHITDAKGTIGLRVVAGQYAINVSPGQGGEPPIAPKRIAAQPITAKSSPLTVEVEAGVAISGKVVYADGTPVTDATVDIHGGIMINRNEHAPDGTFNVTGLSAGKYTLSAVTADGHLGTPPVEVTAPAANVALTMPRGGRIEGRVVERGTSRPVTDFTVAPVRTGNAMMARAAALEKETHADDGAFAVENVTPGTATLRVTARGYVTGTRSDIQVEEGRTVTGIDVQLERGATLHGRVTGDGKPVGGAAVRLMAITGSTSVAPIVTDADGQYSLDGVPAGEHTVEFRKQGFVTKRQTVETAPAKDAQLDVDLEHGRDLRGRVVDRGGAAVDGASISAFPSTGGPNEQTVTGGDGAFVIEGLSESRYNVQVRKNGFTSTSQRDVALPQTSPLVVTLDRGGTVTGRVTGLAPNELASVYVNANAENGFTSAQTDASGSFTLRGVPDGRVTVVANLMGTDRRSKQKSILVENGTAPPLEINFDEGYTVRGRVTFNGVPVTMGSINFYQTPPRPDSNGYGRVSGGTYEINGLSAGEYNVMMSAPEGGYRGKYTVAGSGTFDIDVRGATLHGRVVDADSGAPVADASVNVGGKATTMYGNAISDSDGRFVVPALADGTYSLGVRRDNYSPALQDVTVSGGSVADVEVRLQGGTQMTFLVVDATTQTTIMNAGVSVESGGKSISGGMMRSEDGLHLWLQPGNYTARATAYGYGSFSPQRVEFTVPGPPVRIALSHAGALVVIVRSAGFARVRGPLSAPPPGVGGVVGGGVSRQVLPGPNTFSDLAAGQYVVELLDDSQKNVVKSMPATVVSGEKTTVSLE